MKAKEKVKKFWNENKKEITDGIICGVICGVGLLVGYKFGHYVGGLDVVGGQESIKRTFESIPKGSMVSILSGVVEDGIKVSDLGELGKMVMESGAPSEHKLTHFVAIGPAVK